MTPLDVFDRAQELAAEDSAKCECGAEVDLSDAGDAWSVIRVARSHGDECPLMEDVEE